MIEPVSVYRPQSSDFHFPMSETNQDQIYIDEIARALKNRRAAIMVGSGFSKNASSDFPNWQQLGKRIYVQLYKKEAANQAEYADVPLLAEMLDANQNRHALNSIIRDVIPQGQFNYELHRNLLSLGWADIFTTNYDNLLERAAEDYLPRKYDIVKKQDDLLSFRNRSRLIKLHGDKDDLNNCIITREDYRTYPRKYPIFVNTIQQSLLENLFCLIGFSATDPNFLNWIGWLRDYFGQQLSLSIYLLGIKKPDSFHEKLFESRNIKFVNITQCKRIVDGMPTANFDLASNTHIEKKDTNLHYLSIKNFLAYLKKKSEPDLITERQLEKSDEDFSILWNIASSPYPNPQSDVLSECERIVKEWRQIRESYPGWVVLPYRERNNLWALTQQWGIVFYNGSFSKLSTELQYEFAYEIIWRINKCLSPLDDIIVQFGNTMIDDAEWKAQESSRWFEIVLMLLQEYRTTRNQQKWNESATKVQNEHSRLSPEQWSAFCYESSLKALFSVNTDSLRQTLDDWAEVKSATLLEAKKAALWAELGELEKAKTIITNALETVREQQNTTLNERINLFSQESCILSIMRCIEFADALANEKYDLKAINEKYQNRLDALRQYRCDITEEQLVFSTALKHEPVPPPEAITEKPLFDIGIVNYTQHISNDEDKEMLLGYSYLIYSEETGIPFLLPNFSFDKVSAIGAAKRIKGYCFHWAFTTLLRTGDTKEVDIFFDREDMATLKQEEADYYASLCMGCLESMQKDITGLSKPHWEKNLAANYAGVMPEILSRLCTKCSLDALHKILDYVVKIYNLPEKDKQAFYGVKNLVVRLMAAFPASQAQSVFAAIKKIDYQPHNDRLESVNGFIDPYPPFCQLIGSDYKPSNEDCEFALSLLETHRQQGLGLYLVFYESFTEEQKQRCAKLLWDERFIDAHTGFPQSDIFLCSAFLEMPTPEGINIVERFKKYTFDSIKDKDIFGNITGVTQTVDGQSVTMTGGHSRMTQEWESAYSILSTERFELNADEIRIIYDYIRTYWNGCGLKHNLREQPNPFFSIAGEFRSRFQTLLRILAFVVIPNAVKNNIDAIKEDIEPLLTEMHDAGLNIGLAKVASLALFPDRQSDIQTFVRQVFSRFNKQEINGVLNGLHVLQIMKHKGFSFELDIQWAVGGIVEHIKNWLSPVLDSAMRYFASIFVTAPQFVEEKQIADILPTLDILAVETQLLNRESRIAKNERLTCRREGMRLASGVAQYYQSKNSELPTEIQKWKDIADSPDEFWEVRNEWKQDAAV